MNAQLFLSTLPPGPRERRFALAVVLASLGLFLAAAPFAKEPLTQIWAFIPFYESTLVVNDVITAVLLFGQAVQLARSRAVFVLASGYLFTALMAVSHALTFPGLFSPTGWLGAGPQSTAWLYMFWHGGFPLFVIVYATLTDRDDAALESRRAGVAILASVAAVCVVVFGLTLLATGGHDLLPAIMRGNQYTPVMLAVVSSTWGLSLLALAVLWRRRPHAVLDLWLMVVMFAWLFDIALAAVLNQGRFDLGFYAGRIYGLLAATLVLMVLLIENGKLYARLVGAHRALDRQNRSLEATVRERTERLLQSEKIATMGALLAGVAHELNNPLAVVMGHSTLLKESANDPVVARRATHILAGADRCVRIVRNFLALARQRPPQRREVRLNQIARETVELLAYELRTANVEVRLDLTEALPALWADAHQLQQLLINLVVNAGHAMRHSPAPRTLTITTEADVTSAQVRLTVADTGSGIPAEIRARIFEPFFTTKPQGEGTGLGLSLCRDIVAAHGGTLTVESEPGQGATFILILPVTLQPGERDAPTEADVRVPVAPRSVLVVDDEPEIAAVLAETLEREGHRVEIAHDGAEALRQLERRPYDLILSDTKMPGLDGVEFYREMVRRFPTFTHRIVFMTGDALDPEKLKFFETTGAPALMKPFDLAEVRRVVRRRLGEAAGR